MCAGYLSWNAGMSVASAGCWVASNNDHRAAPGSAGWAAALSGAELSWGTFCKLYLDIEYLNDVGTFFKISRQRNCQTFNVSNKTAHNRIIS